MILLSVTTYLAGIHYDWRLIILGVLLGLTAGVGAIAEQFIWIMLIPAILAGAYVIYNKRKRF